MTFARTAVSGTTETFAKTAVTGSMTFARNAGGDTIVRATGNWITDGFSNGQQISVSGATGGSNGTFTIASVTATTITLTVGNTVTAGTNAGVSVRNISNGDNTFTGDSITRGDGVSWSSDGFAVGEQITISGASAANNGTFTITALSGTSLVMNRIRAVTAGTSGGVFVQDITDGDTLLAGDSITRNDGGDYIADGFEAGDSIIVTGASAGNNTTLTIASLTASTIVLTVKRQVISETQSPVTLRDADTGKSR